MQKKGNINISTENIFPIIKKFLYSEHEIFIRELVSNAVDATQKLKVLANLGEYTEPLDTTSIEVSIDAVNKTITISDKGIGMSEEEVEKYINQVAFSGAEEFLQKYKGKTESAIIGHFGLGFYSAFMVAEKVVIETKSAQKDTPAIRWECDGSPHYTLTKGKRNERGTDIILHIHEDSQQFLEAPTLKEALLKFCKFLPIPIFFEGKQINQTEPLWIKKANDLKNEDYENFYKELYPFATAPLFWIHLNVDYPFHLTGILYFPHITQTYEGRKDKITLYANQVYVTDEVREVVPEFLMLLHGVIDSPDIPLNVSRSYLQGDPNVKKISHYITKKVTDKIEEIFKKDRAIFEEKWPSLNVFVKYGMITDDKFFDRAQQFLCFSDTDKKLHTLPELKEKLAPLHTDKNGILTLLYTTDTHKQDTYISTAQKEGYTVLLMDTPIDAAFLNQAESKLEKIRFKRVDSGVLSQLIEKEETTPPESLLTKEEEQKLNALFTIPEKDKIRFTTKIQALKENDPPLVLTQEEWLRRMQEIAQISGGANKLYADMPIEYQLIINTHHPIHKELLATQDEAIQKALVQELLDLALLTQDMLKGKALTEFITRHTQKLLQKQINNRGIKRETKNKKGA